MTYRIRRAEIRRPFRAVLAASAIAYFSYGSCLGVVLQTPMSRDVGERLLLLVSGLASGLVIALLGLVLVVGLFLWAATAVVAGLTLFGLLAIGVHQRRTFVLVGGCVGLVVGVLFAVGFADDRQITSVATQAWIASAGLPPGLLAGLLLHWAGGVRPRSEEPLSER